MTEEIKNQNLTKQREAVLQVIREEQNHLTANEVFEKAKNLLPTISFATVYNSLRFLKEAGYIGEINFGNGASRFDAITSRHDHAICTQCGTLVDMQIELPSETVNIATHLSGFRLQSIELTLRGICPKCSE